MKYLKNQTGFLKKLINPEDGLFQKAAAFALALATALASPLRLAAIEVPSGMQTLADGIKDIMTGAFVKTIIVIMLVGCAIAYAFNKDNERMKRNIITIAVAIGIIGGAATIIGEIWQASGGKG